MRHIELGDGWLDLRGSDLARSKAPCRLRVAHQDTRTASVHSVNPVVSTVMLLDASTELPSASVTPIVLCAQSNSNPVDVLKNVSTENENPQP